MWLICSKHVTLKPIKESEVIAECSSSFDFALADGDVGSELPVMDGLLQGKKDKESYICNMAMINLGRETQKNSKGTELGTLVNVTESDFAPIQEVLHVYQNRVKLTNVEHVSQIKLNHLPDKYRSEY